MGQGRRLNQASDIAAVAMRANRAAPTNQLLISCCSMSNPIDEPMLAYTFSSSDAVAAAKNEPPV